MQVQDDIGDARGRERRQDAANERNAGDRKRRFGANE
jgi:hypothetical protein